jgi:REP element-mobilizing transposase RayT
MARARRICAAKLTYHVFTRCIDKKKMLQNIFFKELMITVIEETQKKFDFKLNAFEILDNHIHLIIQTENKHDTISKIMQRIKSVFAKRYNKLMGRTGPFWNDRFGSKIVEQAKNVLSYFVQLVHYLANNSVRKGYVTDPRDYKYGSFNCYLKKDYRSKLKVTVHDYFLMLGDTFEECAAALLNFRGYSI